MKSINGTDTLQEGLWYGVSLVDNRLFGNSRNKWKDSKLFGRKYQIMTSRIGEENLGEVNMRRGIFQGDFVITFICVSVTTYTYVKRCCTRKHHCASNGQKVDHLLFTDDMKLYATTEKSLESLIQTVNWNWNLE